MPTRFLSDAQRARYGRFDEVPSQAQIARYFHLDTTDRAIIDQLRGSHNRLGFALQLGIARFLGILPTRFDDIPDVVVEAVAAQLGLTMKPSLVAYAFGRPRKRHAALIRKAYGFRELTDDASARFRLTRWLYTLCWSGDDRPSLLIDRATAWMLANKILLPVSALWSALLPAFVIMHIGDCGCVCPMRCRMRNVRRSPLCSMAKAGRCVGWIPCGQRQQDGR